MGSIAAAIAIAVAIGVPVILLGGVFLAVRRSEPVQSFAVDLQAVYLYIVSLVSVVILLFAVFSLADAALSLAFRTYLPDIPPQAPLEKSADPTAPPPRDFVADQTRFARQQLASTLAAVLVTLPVWWFHWRAARRRSFAQRAFLGHRLYLYAVMVIALIAAVVSGAQAASRLLEWLLGAVDWSQANAAANFWKGALASGIDSLVALGLWTYHRRELASVPGEVLSSPTKD